MHELRLDAVFDETLDGAKAPVWGRCAPRVGKPGAVPCVREDVHAPLAGLRQAWASTATARRPRGLRLNVQIGELIEILTSIFVLNLLPGSAQNTLSEIPKSSPL